ncbi:hypothetical protein BDM02DRAFT_1897564 [Thelephora ganbajun]|uniref:Uncharacterized protein n=1 Tax=Thelephora ganbajun TaxID=370292 RepID=A0ACB6ZUV3_THEGA|nr:hypothetical protein BDM02DRAFT_1897564 [Thelephora ganbajun]
MERVHSGQSRAIIDPSHQGGQDHKGRDCTRPFRPFGYSSRTRGHVSTLFLLSLWIRFFLSFETLFRFFIYYLESTTPPTMLRASMGVAL